MLFINNNKIIFQYMDLEFKDKDKDSNNNLDNNIIKKIKEKEAIKKNSVKKNALKLLFIINILVEIIASLLIDILVGLSFKDPFKDHYIGDLSNYFYDVEKSNNTNNNSLNISSFNNYGNISSAYNIKKKLNLRNLVSKQFCSEMRENFIEFQGSKLEDLFDFKLGKIKLLCLISLGIDILSIIIFMVVMIALICIACKIKKNKEKTYEVNINSIDTILNLMTFTKIIYKIFNVALFVVALILYYQIDKSDLDKYDDFLDCENVKDKFFDEFSDANKLRKVFYIYLFVTITKQGIERLNQAFDFDLFIFFEEKISFKAMDKSNNESVNSAI